jgi:hypothetical protein
MRQRVTLIIALIAVVIILVALNAASYVRVEQEADSELTPDRSTFNSGATGTQAFYDFLHESGRQVVRWRESTSALLAFSGPKPATFVVIGPLREPYSNGEAHELLRWVESGGRLVIIDREPDQRWFARKDWKITSHPLTYPWHDLDPNNFEHMTYGMSPLKPSQPTLLARNIQSVMPSRFLAMLELVHLDPQAESGATLATEGGKESFAYGPSESPTPQKTQVKSEEVSAPVVHFQHERGALLIDYPYGAGRVVVLSDPFIVANNGIGRADNLLLALNIVSANDGLIAFDEFHQGRAATHNALFQYFSGTPVMAICAQLAVIGLAIVWSQGRRFGRPLPLPQVDRRSKLEFVASMAELQQRAKAHDLALENIYTRVRRVLVRYAGVSNSSPRAEIARRVAMRSGIDRTELETLMRNCEDTINGSHTNARETLRMVRRLRDVEAMLGLRTRARDAKQAGE